MRECETHVLTINLPVFTVRACDRLHSVVLSVLKLYGKQILIVVQ